MVTSDCFLMATPETFSICINRISAYFLISDIAACEPEGAMMNNGSFVGLPGKAPSLVKITPLEMRLANLNDGSSLKEKLRPASGSTFAPASHRTLSADFSIAED